MKAIVLSLILFATLTLNLFSQAWIEQTSGVTAQLTSISAVDDNNVWICGYAGNVLRTTNAGVNWVSVTGSPIPASLNMHSIYANDANTALVGGSGTSSFLFRTTNAGATWTQVFTEPGGFINSVHMGNAFAGYMMGDPVGGRWSLWGTTDAGITWDSSTFYLPAGSASEAGWNNAFFFDINAGVFFGTNNTRVYKTVNLVNWQTQPTAPQLNSYAIWFNSMLGGMLGGTGLLQTTNGGTNWVSPASPLPGTANISGMTGINLQYWVIRQSNIIYSTFNNGASWLTSYTAATGHIYRHIARPRNGNFTFLYAVKSNGGITRGTIPLGITPISNEIPKGFALKQNYPNPFNPVTTINFNIPRESSVKLAVYDGLGKEIKVLVNENLRPGIYEINFEGNNVSSGIYYYRLITPDFTETKKMTLVK